MIAIKIPYASTEITRFSKLNKNFVNNGIRQIPKCANRSIDKIEKEIRFERPKNCERSNQKFAITTKLCANKKISFRASRLESETIQTIQSFQGGRNEEKEDFGNDDAGGYDGIYRLRRTKRTGGERGF